MLEAHTRRGSGFLYAPNAMHLHQHGEHLTERRNVAVIVAWCGSKA
jgi:hypothetical protein